MSDRRHPHGVRRGYGGPGGFDRRRQVRRIPPRALSRQSPPSARRAPRLLSPSRAPSFIPDAEPAPFPDAFLAGRREARRRLRRPRRPRRPVGRRARSALRPGPARRVGGPGPGPGGPPRGAWDRPRRRRVSPPQHDGRRRPQPPEPPRERPPSTSNATAHRGAASRAPHCQTADARPSPSTATATRARSERYRLPAPADADARRVGRRPRHAKPTRRRSRRRRIPTRGGRRVTHARRPPLASRDVRDTFNAEPTPVMEPYGGGGLASGGLSPSSFGACSR